MTSTGTAQPTFRTYVRDVVASDRRGFAASTVLTLLGSLTESFGLLLLVPLVVAAGVVDGGSSPLTDQIVSVFDSVGVPFSLGWVLLVYVVLVAVRAVIGCFRSIVTAEFQYQFVDRLRMRVFDAVAHADWRFHLAQRNSDTSHVITSDVGRVQSGTNVAFDLFGRAVMALGYLAVAFRLSAPTTALAVGLLVVLIAGLWPTVGRARRMGTLQTTFGRQAFGQQNQFLDALKLAKSHGAEARHVEAYRDNVTELREAQVENQRVMARSAAAVTIGVAATVAVLAWAAVTRFDTPGPELLALIAVFSRLAPVASVVLNRSQQVANMLPAYANALELEHAARVAVEASRSSGTVAALQIRDSVELDAVSFSYWPDTDVLCAVSLSIPAGATVAVVGPSGAGKTTLGDIVLGLLTPSSGAMLVDGDELSTDRLGAWRASLAYVPQETFLFHDTLRSNILWAAHPEVDDEELESLVDAAALRPVIDALPDGLDTVVGDRGYRLSGGERQRVALARALARRPSLLVLDEATSALDDVNERSVQTAIDGLHGDVTMLVIAHRMGTIRNADQIIVLDGGQVVDRGSWDELTGRGVLTAGGVA